MSKLYMSKSAHYHVWIRDAITQTRKRGNDFYDHVISGPLEIHFERGRADPYAFACGLNHWNGGISYELGGYAHGAYGAHPSMVAEPEVKDDGGTLKIVAMTAPWRPETMFSFFDTKVLDNKPRPETEENPEGLSDRALTERLLDTNPANGLDYIEITPKKLPAPWPKYDSLGQGAAIAIPATVRSLGLDPAAVIAYEAANKNREGVIANLQKLVDETQAEILEAAALEVEVQ